MFCNDIVSNSNQTFLNKLSGKLYIYDSIIAVKNNIEKQ